jgi:phosphopantothenoylcysteine decarboxylase/phosphopantothenate--cysteine ligase
VVVGVAGGIAAYKVCSVVRGLAEAGHEVHVVPTAAALRFVGAATWEALSGRPVHTDVFAEVPQVLHVAMGRQADLVLVAPATADLMARAAHGLADDLLTSTLLTAHAPVVMAPAMHTEMWEHPATRANVATLRERGVLVVEPGEGRLTGADTGAGRLPEPDDLLAVVRAVLDHPGTTRDLHGRRVLITAGSTQEALDPVRYLTNHSSGRQGFALARVAALRGADVTLVAGVSDLAAPAGVRTERVTSARDMHAAVLEALDGMDAVVMAAAVADHRPAHAAGHKVKKQAGARVLDLVDNPDILLDVVARPAPGRVVVGFAAETGDAEADVAEHGRRKLAAKGAHLLVVNRVGGGLAFGTPDNEVVVLGDDGTAVEVPLASKEKVAGVVWDLVRHRWPGTVSSRTT